MKFIGNTDISLYAVTFSDLLINVSFVQLDFWSWGGAKAGVCGRMQFLYLTILTNILFLKLSHTY